MRKLIIGCCAAAGLLLGGCSARLTRENYDKIEKGMTRSQVESILGPGEEVDSAGIDIPTIEVGDFKIEGVTAKVEYYRWTSNDTRIFVAFHNDKVVGKSAENLPAPGST